METHRDVVFTRMKTLHSISIGHDSLASSSHGSVTSVTTPAYDQTNASEMTLDAAAADNSLAFLTLSDRLRMGEFSNEQPLCTAMPSNSPPDPAAFDALIASSIHHSTMIKTEDPFLHATLNGSHLGAAGDHFLYQHHQPHNGFAGNFTAMLNDGDVEALPNIQTMMSVADGAHSSGSLSAGFHHLTGPMSNAAAAVTYQDMITSRPTFVDDSVYQDEPSFGGACESAEAPGVFERIKHEVVAEMNDVVMRPSNPSTIAENTKLADFGTLLQLDKQGLSTDVGDLPWSNQRKRARCRAPLLTKIDSSCCNSEPKLSNLDDLMKRSTCSSVAAAKADNSVESDAGENKIGVVREKRKLPIRSNYQCSSPRLRVDNVATIASEFPDLTSVVSHADVAPCQTRAEAKTFYASSVAFKRNNASADSSAVENEVLPNGESTPTNKFTWRVKHNKTDGSSEDNVVASWPSSAELGNAIAEVFAETSPAKTMLGGSRGFGEKLEVKVQVEEGQCVTVDGARRWKCLQCPKMYSTKNNLVIHILGHSGIKPHSCTVCSKLFSQISHLQSHMLTHGNVKPHVCHVCQRSFTQASHVKRHLAMHLGASTRGGASRSSSPFRCTHCDRAFAYPSDLRLHVEQRHKQVDGATAQQVCEECGVACEGGVEGLQRHKMAEHRSTGPEARLSCKVCAKMYAYPSQLRDHAARHNGDRPYICGECGVDFMKEHHLKSHMFTHTGLRPFQCKQCPRAFNQKANLQRHLLIHNGEKKFACEVCGRGFTQYQILRAHLITHADTKPFQCKVCGKGFSRLHNLNGHMHMHDGGKPFLCSCGATFTLKGNLNRHKRDKHGHKDDGPAAEECDQSANLVASTRESNGKTIRRKGSGRTSEEKRDKPSSRQHDDAVDNSVGNEKGNVGKRKAFGSAMAKVKPGEARHDGQVADVEGVGVSAKEEGGDAVGSGASAEECESARGGEEDCGSTRGSGAATPKKKRKSMPPRKTTTTSEAADMEENEEEEDVRAAWQLTDTDSLVGEESTGSEADEERAGSCPSGVIGGDSGGRAEGGCSPVEGAEGWLIEGPGGCMAGCNEGGMTGGAGMKRESESQQVEGVLFDGGGDVCLLTLT